MATAKDSIKAPRGLWRNRNGVWYFCRAINGRTVRLSLGTHDLATARRMLGNIEDRARFEAASTWWRQEIEDARSERPKCCLKKMLATAKNRSEKRHVGFSLTLPQLVFLATACEGRCSVSGMELSPERFGRRRPFYPSLDRVDSSLGYTLDNCRIVCLIVNYAMADFGADAFLTVARAAVLKELRERSSPEFLTGKIQAFSPQCALQSSTGLI